MRLSIQLVGILVIDTADEILNFVPLMAEQFLSVTCSTLRC